MIKEFLPNEVISKIEHHPTYIDSESIVEVSRISGIMEMQFLELSPWTKINMHGHDNGQWEIWLLLKNRRAYICMQGEKHELENDSDDTLKVLAIKGEADENYNDLATMLHIAGYSVSKGSLKASKV